MYFVLGARAGRQATLFPQFLIGQLYKFRVKKSPPPPGHHIATQFVVRHYLQKMPSHSPIYTKRLTYQLILYFSLIKQTNLT